jgi:hypothetical protein
VGNLDPMLNKELCAVVDILAHAEITWYKPDEAVKQK